MKPNGTSQLQLTDIKIDDPRKTIRSPKESLNLKVTRNHQVPKQMMSEQKVERGNLEMPSMDAGQSQYDWSKNNRN